MLVSVGEGLGVKLYIAKLLNWNFHTREVVSRWRDPQLQVIKLLEVNDSEILLIDVTF